MVKIETATFGYREGGHQLIESTLAPTTPVLDSLRFPVDRPAGHVGPEVSWSPYWGGQTFERWWALWRGEEDFDAARRNVVRVRVALIPVESCANLDDIGALISAVDGSPFETTTADLAIAGEVVDYLAQNTGPAVVPELTAAPRLLTALWSRLWPAARETLTLRTLFGPESVASVPSASIVVIPRELKPRWLGHKLLKGNGAPAGPAARAFTGSGTGRETRIMLLNGQRFAADLTIFERVSRIAASIDKLASGEGVFRDALLVARTTEAFTGGLELPKEDAVLVGQALREFASASVSDVRAASLTRLDQFTDISEIRTALAKWIEKHLPEQSTTDALWICLQAAGETHAEWWRNGVASGIRLACQARPREWATSIWAWWQKHTDSVTVLATYLDNSQATERWLAAQVPHHIENDLLDSLALLCGVREWPHLLSAALGTGRPLDYCVRRVRATLARPEAALESLLAGRDAKDVLNAAILCDWDPLLAHAVKLALVQPLLFEQVVPLTSAMAFFARYLIAGGSLPASFVRRDFLDEVVNGAKAGDNGCLEILRRLDRRFGKFVLWNPAIQEIFSVNDELTRGAVDVWWQQFVSDGDTERPPSTLVPLVLQRASTEIRHSAISLVVRLLQVFPETTETEFQRWITPAGHRWEPADHQRIAELLIERRWRRATSSFRRSYDHDLGLVAWYARELLPWYNAFDVRPDRVDATDGPLHEGPPREFRRQVKLLFLAANPVTTDRLALDEEARAIEEKVRDARHRDHVVVKTKWAVRPEDLQQSLLEYEPTIVHFSGHGDGNTGIVLASADESEESHINGDALVHLFDTLKDGIRMIVLNACYSQVQAEAIRQKIDFVVGMADSIGDDAARIFAAAFYRGLAFGRSIQTAFDLGISELKLHRLESEDSTPVLLIRDGADPADSLI